MAVFLLGAGRKCTVQGVRHIGPCAVESVNDLDKIFPDAFVRANAEGDPQPKTAVVRSEEKSPETAEAKEPLYVLDERRGGWYNVCNRITEADMSPRNLRLADAQKLLDSLNA